jgi:tetratricopeptide (TPR) repeat protein
MDNLQNGIAAFKDGKRDEARKYFIAAMKEEPNNENVWGWLYQVSNNDNERIQALSKVVALNPQNVQAKQLLDKLQAPPLMQTQAAPVISPPKQNPITTQPKNNNSTLRIVLAVLISIFVVFCCLIALSNTFESLSTGTKIKYAISGSAQSAMITYYNETGGLEQVTQALPFIKEFSVEPGAFLSLVAQNQGAGTITCEIWINGEKKKTSTTTTQYGIATCSDIVY